MKAVPVLLARASAWALLLSFLLVGGAVSGQEGQPSAETAEFATLRIDDTDTVSGEAVEQTLRDLDQQQPQPQHVVVLIHGYDMGHDESTRLYTALTQQIRRQLAPDRVAIVGLQWESGGGNIINPVGDYFHTLSRSRSIGRGPARQLLLALQDRYPSLDMSLMAHSMGCEISVAAVAPEARYQRNGPEGGTYEADREITLTMATFVGADLDYDIWYQIGDAAINWFDRVQLTWSTVSDPTSRGDKVLSMRARLRGKAAGALFPRMTQGQLDRIIPSRRYYLDGQEVPSNHAFDSYFSHSRLTRIMSAMKYLTQPNASEPPELAALHKVLDAPDDLAVLVPMLDSPYAGAAFYALWRVERLNDGDARHMSDQTLENAVLQLADSPQSIWRVQATSECLTMRKAQFPTPGTMRRAGAPPWARPSRWKPQI